MLANSNVIDLALFVLGRYVQIHALARNRHDRCVRGAQAQATQLGRRVDECYRMFREKATDPWGTKLGSNKKHYSIVQAVLN